LQIFEKNRKKNSAKIKFHKIPQDKAWTDTKAEIPDFVAGKLYNDFEKAKQQLPDVLAKKKEAEAVIASTKTKMEAIIANGGSPPEEAASEPAKEDVI
jgi:hypothetical protein